MPSKLKKAKEKIEIQKEEIAYLKRMLASKDRLIDTCKETIENQAESIKNINDVNEIFDCLIEELRKNLTYDEYKQAYDDCMNNPAFHDKPVVKLLNHEPITIH
ncbi:hypothetical protein IAE23_29365 [Bacillus sp. S35]|nr:hypothetical protein [Bacillus sp. S35]